MHKVKSETQEVGWYGVGLADQYARVIAVNIVDEGILNPNSVPPVLAYAQTTTPEFWVDVAGTGVTPYSNSFHAVYQPFPNYRKTQKAEAVLLWATRRVGPKWEWVRTVLVPIDFVSSVATGSVTGTFPPEPPGLTMEPKLYGWRTAPPLVSLRKTY